MIARHGAESRQVILCCMKFESGQDFPVCPEWEWKVEIRQLRRRMVVAACNTQYRISAVLPIQARERTNSSMRADPLPLPSQDPVYR
jgi:hypothetical protein